MMPRLEVDAAAVIAVHHSLRRQILEVLDVHGPATASQLSERTDQRVGNISHHLKMLSRAGLIVEAPDLARDRRERWWRRAGPFRERGPKIGPQTCTKAGHGLGSGAGAGPVEDAGVRQDLAHHVDKVDDWLEQRGSYEPGWLTSAYTGDIWLKLTPEELTDLARRLDALFGEFHTRSDRGDDPSNDRRPVFAFAYAIPVRP